MFEFLPDALQRFLDESGVPYQRKARSFLLTCPRCNKAKKLWILIKNGSFICWKCAETENFRGWAPDALSEITGHSPGEIRARIYAGFVKPGDQLDFSLSNPWFDESELIDIQTSVEIPEIDWPVGVCDLNHPAGFKGLAYLQSRGVPFEVAKRYDIMYWPAKRRVVIPVKRAGKLVGYQARAIDPDREPKILTSEGLRREHIVMFEDNLRGKEHAVICEGPFDAIKADLCGGNVATMGKAVTKDQLQLIRSFGIKRIYLALDPDAADETCRLAKDLGDLKTYLLNPPQGREDLGDSEFEEVWEEYLGAREFTAGNLLLNLRCRYTF